MNTPHPRFDATAAPDVGRTSINFTIPRQTPKTDFGERILTGVGAAGGALAEGVGIAAPYVPGGAIVSAAVSSVTTMGQGLSSGQAAASMPYASTGLVPVGSSTSTTGSGNPGQATASSSSAQSPMSEMQAEMARQQADNPRLLEARSESRLAQMNAELVASQAENGKMLAIQIAMQRENQVFTTVSNILKVRHDTVKNSISNVR